MKKLIAIFLVGLVFLSFGSQAASWEMLWDKQVGNVVVDHNLIDNTVRLFATDKATGDLYSYNERSNGWTRASDRAKAFVSSGEGLFRLSSDGMKTSRYVVPENWEILPGGSALTLIGGGNKLYSTKSPYKDLYEYTGASFKLIKDGRGKVFAAGGCQECSNPDNLGYIYRIAEDGQSVWMYPKSKGELKWEEIGGPASAIYAGAGNLAPSVFAVDPVTGTLWHYKGVAAWDQVGYSGKMWAIDIIVDGWNVRETLYGLSPSGNDIYQWGGDPDPDDWTKIDTAQLNKPLQSIYAGGGQLYAVASGGRLWKYVP